jgi:hypothetical protein
MRTATLLILLSLTASISAAYAEETSDGGEEIAAYCNEQAELAGIEDASEFRQYVQECIDSYSMPSAE